MKGIHGLAAYVVSIGIFAAASTISAHQRADADDGFAQFEQTVGAYVTLRAGVERTVPPLEITRDARKLHEGTMARAEAIRAARFGAQEGDLFAPAIRDILRGRIGEYFATAPGGYAAVLTAAIDEDEAPPAPAVVHGRFEWASGSFMPGPLIAALPPLPPGLQYRFAGPDLVLVDVDAALIIDVLRDAIDSGMPR